MTVYVAPKGARVFAKGGWEPIGTAKSIEHKVETTTLHGYDGSRLMPTSRSIYIELEDGRTIYAPSATFKQISENNFEVVLEHYSFPQRYMLGLDQESYLPPYGTHTDRIDYTNAGGRTIQLGGNGIHPMINSRPGVGIANDAILASREIPNFAHELFQRSRDMPKAKLSLPGGGQPYIFVGEGDTQARVYTPKTKEQAERNLNFAIANLKAYQQWEKHTLPAKLREEEAKKKAEEAEKKRAEEAARAARIKAGLDLYNKVNGTRHVTWSSTVVGLTGREKWADQAEAINKLKRESNPFHVQITADQINSSVISAASIRNSIFGF